jgi:hypothetical protein
MASLKPEILLWKDLPLVLSEQLLHCKTTEERIAALREVLGVREGGKKRDLITLDMYTYLVQFAMKEKLSPAQMSVLYSILKRVHQSCLSTPYDNMEETFDLFKGYLLCHSVDRPPFSVLLFSVEQVKSITEYFLSTYFKHYRLYKYAFTKKQCLNITFMYSDLPESPPSEQTEAAVDEETRVETEMKETSQQDEEEEKPDELDTSQALDPREAEVQKLMEEQLSDKLQTLRTSVMQELDEYDKRMSNKISTFEANATKGKTKKK